MKKNEMNPDKTAPVESDESPGVHDTPAPGAAQDVVEVRRLPDPADVLADPVEPSPSVPPPAAGPAPAVTLDGLAALHVDAMGGFDPSVHAVDKDGNPRRRGDGSFAMKRGRKPGQTTAARPTPGQPGEMPRPQSAPNSPAQTVDPETANIEQASRTAANLLIGTSVMVFGEDFAPENKGEAVMLQTAFRDYFAERGVAKLPPELALAAVVAAYMLPRFTKPKARDRLGALKYSVSKFFSKFRRKRHGDAADDQKAPE